MENGKQKNGLVGVKEDLCNGSNKPLTFWIPKYQRGYRWSEEEIEKLIGDILEFDKINAKIDISKGGSATCYLMQNLIVSKKSIDINGNYGDVFEVIDGQQRLTTVYLILSCIYKQYNQNTDLFKIYYEKYNNQSIDNIINNTNNVPKNDLYVSVDSYYLNKAKEIIENRIKNNDLEDNTKIKKLFEEKIQFIFYEVSSKEKESFTNVNMRKIPLESGDLIKGSLLKRNEIKTEHNNIVITNIANKWNKIEEELNNEELFRFYWDADKKYSRIETIFDVYATMLNENPNNQNQELTSSKTATYDAINNKIDELKKEKGLDVIWNEITKYYSYIKDWYNDRMLYHYIGYLLLISDDVKNKIIEIVKKIDECNNKNEIENRIKEEIIKVLKKCKIKNAINKSDNSFIEDLTYEKHGSQIEKILILFNILIVLKDLDNEKFSFNRFTKDNYDIEHIHPQTDSLSAKNDKIEWIINFTETLNDNIEGMIKSKHNNKNNIIYKLAKSIEEELNTEANKNKSPKEKHKIIENRVKDKYEESSFKKNVDKNISDLLDTFANGNFDKHHIGNLVLLNESINRGYHNAIYPEKLRYIQEYDMTTKFIPIGTKNAMFKYYSDNKGKSETLKWTEADFNCYQKKIVEVMDDFTKNFKSSKEKSIEFLKYLLKENN